MSLNPDQHQLLVFWVGLLVILVAARLLGAVMQRIGQPAVIGELAAGLILGPSVLGKLAPDITDWLFPPTTSKPACSSPSAGLACCSCSSAPASRPTSV